MAKEFKRKTEIECISTWENLKHYIEIGKAREFFVDKNKKHSVTLAVRDLVFGPMQFSKKRENKWETSDIRKYINSEEFINRFESEFRELLCKVYKDNGPKGKETIDTFFLPSVEEVKGGYAFFENEKKRVKITPEGELYWYWTRSASRGNAYGTWYVHPSGDVYYSCASWTYRFCPVCVIAV